MKRLIEIHLGLSYPERVIPAAFAKTGEKAEP